MHAAKFSQSLVALALFAALAVLPGHALAGRAGIDRIVAFGTSLSDPGNAFVWLSDPANEACGTRLNVPPFDALDDLLIPDGPYATGGHHVTNGATWVEGMARGLALAGNARPALLNDGPNASNYATSGARAIGGYPCRFNLPEQVAMYVADFGSTPASAIVVIEAGSNDVRDALMAAAFGGNPIPYIQNALASIATSVVQLHATGARRFLVANVPDIGKTPALRRLDVAFPGIAAFGGVLAGHYNAGLMQVMVGLAGLPDIDIRILDLHAILEQVIASPGTYGFANATDACITPGQPPFRCAKPDSYVFWDGTHPTSALHAIVAQRALLAVTTP